MLFQIYFYDSWIIFSGFIAKQENCERSLFSYFFTQIPNDRVLSRKNLHNFFRIWFLWKKRFDQRRKIFTINQFTYRGNRDHKITTPTWPTVSQTLLFWTVFKCSTSTSPIQTVPTPIPLVTESVVSEVSTHYPYRCSNTQQLLLLLRPAISNALSGGKSAT